MSRYRTPINLPSADPTPAGEDRVPVCQLAADGLSLMETGSYSQTELIQSYAEETDIHTIISRAAAGDLSVLQRVQGIYTDLTGAPTTLAQIHDLIEDARSRYDALSDDLRSEIGDFASYAALISDPAALAEFEAAHKPTEEVHKPTEEVHDNG